MFSEKRVHSHIIIIIIVVVIRVNLILVLLVIIVIAMDVFIIISVNFVFVLLAIVVIVMDVFLIVVRKTAAAAAIPAEAVVDPRVSLTHAAGILLKSTASEIAASTS